jgi:hypothetical protein
MANEPFPPQAPDVSAGQASEPEIYTIPDKFYGAALKANVTEVKKSAEAPPAAAAPTERKPMNWVLPVIIGVVLLVGVAGGFVYFNKDLLFKKPAPVPEVPVVPVTPPPPSPPSAPSDLSATATAPTVVNLTWKDNSQDEAGFRIERREQATTFASLTSLPPNSTAFLDSSAQAGQQYVYRIIAMNAGGDSAPSNEATAMTPTPPPPPPEVPKLPPAGLDSDSDGLTDLEEALYGTNPRNPDTDGDSFNDGNEVYHLYNPLGRPPTTLLDSGVVKPFESPVGWRLYVPNAWQTKLEESGMKGTITTGHGETFTITLEDNPLNQTLLDWYLGRNPGVLSTQVRAYVTTKASLDALEGADPLVTYFKWGNKILSIRYNLDDQPFVNFRTTYGMMLNSLSLTTAPNLPFVPPAESASSTAPAVAPAPAAPATTPAPEPAQAVTPAPIPTPAPEAASSTVIPPPPL